MPTGRPVVTKGGTQIIDRFWSTLRKHLNNRPKRPGTATTEDRVRAAQWRYWNKGADLWLATGNMLHDVLPEA